MTKKTGIAGLTLSGINGLDNEKRIRILGIIDKLRELGVSENVSLPQLVVVGDQSSGKSSLLEGLTGLSFPIASDLCTRFATQIVLRRAPAEEAIARVTIIPGPNGHGNEQMKEHPLSFERILAADEFDAQAFGSVFDEAAQHMGVPGSNTKKLEGLDKRFSDDILKIELSGPEHRHLSVVDVPGLFHNPTKYQTEEDRAIIHNLIESYITDKRTIILAVMDAKNNLANQEVFSMARAADPEGSRTVGIITKCDTVQVGDEEGVLRIAKNEVEKLKHGWFSVKNRSTKEIKEGITIEERHRREQAFFSSEAPWTQLSKERVGIGKVKSFLGQLLYDHIRQEFPAMVKEIEELALQTQNELELLGPSRQTPSDQRRFLMRIATKYQQAVSDALNGNYGLEIGGESALKLRMQVRDLNEKFAEELTRRGHTMVFRTVNNEIDNEYARKGDKENIYDWIRGLYRESRGAELPGTVNPSVLENMFRQQSTQWKHIATGYLRSITEIIGAFNREIFERMISDGELREKLKSRLHHFENLAFKRADEQLEKILSDERTGILQTVNHYFADTLSAIRQERVLARIKPMADYSGFNVNELMRCVHLSNEDQAVNDIHDILKAYYKVAVKRFADNVVLQVTERHLLGIHGPVRALSPDFIGDLPQCELEDVAAENFATSSARVELRTRCERLQGALEVAKQAGI
ncbi:hypothetical protein ACJ73_06779 [Blastomyces percursus]|uniref:GED domain-containing protein n=1 Tax=Blastomyces percursus TaxID=1658174 RepID=A0A1J9R072_9EURO|nr:hypothetical protein ACJ73_06779 [Blastomyces percursus]